LAGVDRPVGEEMLIKSFALSLEDLKDVILGG
jgi:hypothetical protein